MRIRFASVGVTDTMAVRGDYLLAPRPGFAAGYDFVGEIERVPDGAAHLSVGMPVAGILPGMGAHASRVAVPASLLVPVPDAVPLAHAATVPLDAVTAWFALASLTRGAGNVLVQGAGGAVGGWATQLAAGRGLSVWGTASRRSRGQAERLGARVLDYRGPWVQELRQEVPGGVDGAIDHTGNAVVRESVRPDGRIVRIAFGSAASGQRWATAMGFARAGLRRFARPSERVCSVPMIVRQRRGAYREALASVLDLVARGEVAPPEPRAFPMAEYGAALAAAERAKPGTKVVLAL